MATAEEHWAEIRTAINELERAYSLLDKVSAGMRARVVAGVAFADAFREVELDLTDEEKALVAQAKAIWDKVAAMSKDLPDDLRTASPS